MVDLAAAVQSRMGYDQPRKWLQKNTYHHSAFEDLAKLVELKEKKNLSISLCIPTFNEEKTIGKEVVIFVSELMKRYPLIDEFAVIDSGSKDRTLEIARVFGADTYLADEVLSYLPYKKGKGENLWKAVYQLKGDIIVYVDADIENIHPRFVYGLVGPLIEREEIKYVKAFYERPIAYSDGIRMSGGGRVTEILIRPLFSLFFPDLCGIVQPLSGEYAVRREILESISFPIGYGVETSHLLDVMYTYGIEAFAQTDLDQRIHRNQPITSLSRMSFSILQIFFSRLYHFGIMEAKEELYPFFRSVQVREQEFELLEQMIVEEERPPMLNIPEYMEKFSRGKFSRLNPILK